MLSTELPCLLEMHIVNDSHILTFVFVLPFMFLTERAAPLRLEIRFIATGGGMIVIG